MGNSDDLKAQKIIQMRIHQFHELRLLAECFILEGLACLVQLLACLHVSAYQRQHGKCLLRHLLQKQFSNRVFYVTITDADIESLNSLYTLFKKCSDHRLVKFQQNRIDQMYTILSLLGKMVTYFFFQKVLTPFLEDASMT